MRKNHQHKPDIACTECVLTRYANYDKLLEFVKSLASIPYGVSEEDHPLEFEIKSWRNEARATLKEIGEE